MALNREVFKTRALSAVVFAMIMLVGLLWNPWSFLLLFSIIHFGCWWEYLKMIELIHKVAFHRFIKFGFMLMGFGIMLSFCGLAYRINGYGLKENLCLPLSLAGFILLVIGIFQKNIFKLKAFGAAALGWLYISMSWGMMLGIRQIWMTFQDFHLMFDFGCYFSIALIVSIWINDTMAYIVGSLIGKTPFSKISPKKTWEGIIGGALLCILVMSLATHYGVKFSWGLSIGIPLIAAFVGTLGDLLESKIKRMAMVKDSGNMMPGHGGFLDRFDSLLLATPFVWLLVQVVS